MSGPGPRSAPSVGVDTRKGGRDLWRDVFTQWFPSNPYRSRPGPEISRVRLRADGAEADAELWIPVERVPA